MGCGSCGVLVCPNCGKFYPCKSPVCPECGQALPRKVCPYCHESYTGFTGDPPVCPNCCETLPRKEFL